jgi:hypothetical protein
MVDQVMLILITAAVTGALSTAATVITLRVHIGYLREHIDKIESALARVHSRIDSIIIANARAMLHQQEEP